MLFEIGQRVKRISTDPKEKSFTVFRREYMEGQDDPEAAYYLPEAAYWSEGEPTGVLEHCLEAVPDEEKKQVVCIKDAHFYYNCLPTDKLNDFQRRILQECLVLAVTLIKESEKCSR